MEKIVIPVARSPRPSERLLRGAMAALAVLFLLGAILLDRGLMLPCFLMAVGYFIYTVASKRQYEYILENGRLRVDRLTDYGRLTRHDISLREVELLSRPDDPAAAPYKKGGTVKVKKYDYTSYRDGVPYYTMIAREDGRRVKLLLDLDEAAIACIKRENREAVKGL